MKLYMYVHKNLTLGCSGVVKFDDHEPEVFAKQLERQVLIGKPEDVAKYVNTELYFLGTYEDETLCFNLESSPRLILDYNQALDNRKVRFEILKMAQAKREALLKEKEGVLDESEC